MIDVFIDTAGANTQFVKENGLVSAELLVIADTSPAVHTSLLSIKREKSDFFLVFT